MSASTFTPGPWRVSLRRRNLVVIGDGFGHREYSVADCPFSSSQAANARTPSAAECIANAQLVAAAPDLLTALQALLSRHNDGSSEGPWAEWDTAVEAVAKAVQS